MNKVDKEHISELFDNKFEQLYRKLGISDKEKAEKMNISKRVVLENAFANESLIDKKSIYKFLNISSITFDKHWLDYLPTPLDLNTKKSRWKGSDIKDMLMTHWNTDKPQRPINPNK